MYSPRMCSHRSSVMVAMVLMTTFLRCSEAMPQSQSNQCHSNDASISDIIRENERNANADACTCVKFHDCGDPLPKNPKKPEPTDFLGLIDERTGNPVIDIQCGECKGQGLSICCKKIKTKPPPPIVTPRQWECGKRQADGVRVVVNGFSDGQTQLGEFPWMVAVLGRDTTYIGGGSLVRRRVVLTAGHKVYEKSANSLVARIGDWDLSGDDQEEHISPQNIDVEKILWHPDFKRDKHEYNVAILILKTEAVYGETVAPICLPDPGQNFDGANCTVTGWGKDDFKMGEYQTIMKKVDVPMVSNNECQSMLRETRLGSDYILHNSFNCAGGLEEDACTGDGGSPLVCPNVNNPQQLVQVGVVSWGIGCGIVGNPGVYGSIPESMDWIARAIQDEIGIDVDPRLGQNSNSEGR